MKGRRATVKTKIKDLNKPETMEHYNAVLLEDIKGQMQFVVEGMESFRVEVKRDINDLERNLTLVIRSIAHACW